MAAATRLSLRARQGRDFADAYAAAAENMLERVNRELGGWAPEDLRIEIRAQLDEILARMFTLRGLLRDDPNPEDL